MNWSQICQIQSGHFRVGDLMIRVFASSGLLRVEYFSRATGKWLLWKLDEVHELLILQVLRDKIAKLKADLYAERVSGRPDIEWKQADLDRLKRIMDEIGARQLAKDNPNADTAN